MVCLLLIYLPLGWHRGHFVQAFHGLNLFKVTLHTVWLVVAENCRRILQLHGRVIMHQSFWRLIRILGCIHQPVVESLLSVHNRKLAQLRARVDDVLGVHIVHFDLLHPDLIELSVQLILEVLVMLLHRPHRLVAGLTEQHRVRDLLHQALLLVVVLLQLLRLIVSPHSCHGRHAHEARPFNLCQIVGADARAHAGPVHAAGTSLRVRREHRPVLER